MAGTFGGPAVSLLVDLTYYDAKFNYIDDPSNLKDDRVFIYGGKSRTALRLAIDAGCVTEVCALISWTFSGAFLLVAQVCPTQW